MSNEPRTEAMAVGSDALRARAERIAELEKENFTLCARVEELKRRVGELEVTNRANARLAQKALDERNEWEEAAMVWATEHGEAHIDRVAAEAQRDEARGLLQEIWDSVPASHDPEDPMVQRHAAALRSIPTPLDKPTLHRCDICNRELGLIAPSEADAARVETPKGRLLICPQCREDDRQERAACNAKP